MQLIQHSKKTLRHSVFIMSIFLSLHTALYTYIHSSAASRFIPENTVGLIYTIASLGSLLLLTRISQIMKRFGVYAVYSVGLFCGFTASVLLGIAHGVELFIPAFILLLIANRILWISADILLEHYSDENQTGTIRGLYLTLLNGIWILGPLIAGKLGTTSVAPIYFMSALMIVPISIILRARFRHYHDALYTSRSIFSTIRTVVRRSTLRPVFITTWLLNLFYALIVIYIPLYLIEHFHFSLQTLTVIFALALLPFPLLEYPLGRLVDRGVRERYILIPGFLILGFCTMAISFMYSGSIVAWALLLIGTRIGASAIEAMNEVYFFRHVADNNSDTIATYRMIDPLAYTIGPLLASLFVSFFGLQYLFVFLGIVLMIGIFWSLQFK